MSSKVRLTLDVSRDLNNVLENIAEETGSTKTDVFRKAIALLDAAHQAKRRGERVGTATRDQDLKTEFINI